VRTDDGWRIRERRLDRWWTAGNPAVVARPSGSVPPVAPTG